MKTRRLDQCAKGRHVGFSPDLRKRGDKSARCTLTNQPQTSFIVSGLPAPARLDQLLRGRFPEWGRQAVDRLIARRGVLVNGKVVWLASWKVQNGDQLQIDQPPLPKPASVATWDDRWLLAADEHLIVVDKPAGLLSEAPPLRPAPNLHSLAQERFGPLTLLHRLDRDTSGVLVLARTPEATRVLAAAWQGQAEQGQAGQALRVTKEYVAVVTAPNRLEESGRISARLGPDPRRRQCMVVVPRGGQGAITRYAVARRAAGRQLLHLWPETGRTHQLRVHLASLGAPILGDRLYGDAESAPRLLLHAWRITLPPLAGLEPVTYCAPLPQEFTWEEAGL